MSELQDIKRRVFEENQVEFVLETLDCWGIDKEQNGKLYVAGLPDGDNKRSVQIKNAESLSSAIRSKGIQGDIYDIISFIVFDADTEDKRKSALSKSKFWLCQKLNYVEYIDDFYKETSNEIKKTPKFNKWLNDLRKKNHLENIPQNDTYPENVLSQYEIVPYKKWLDEGLKYSTQKLFQIGIDVRSDRITFPVHNRKGDLVGIKARYCGSNKKIENDYKYLYLYPCNKSIEFFNFHRALPFIQEKKEVIVVEGGKTTMYLHQWDYKNSISIEGDSLSDYQIFILKELGIDINYIFAYDKDKDAKFVHEEVSRLRGRKRFGIFDKDGLLDDKDSPTDKGKDVWEKLYNEYRYKIR